MSVEAGGILDTRNAIGIPNFDGSDANLESWRVRFGASADVANMGRTQTLLQNSHHSSDTHGLDDNSLLMSKTVRTLLITKCVGRARSLVSLVHRRHGFEAWRVLKEEYEGKGGNRIAPFLRGILNPRARRENMNSEGRDFGDMRASREKDVAQYSVAAGADLKQAVYAATVMEHAAAAYRDLLKVVPLANRETCQALRAYVRGWTLAQRTYNNLGRHATPHTSAPMDIGQAKGTKRKGKKGQERHERERKGERQRQARQR